jgi:chromosome segregation ATPase
MSTTPNIQLPFDERNQQDFLDVTGRIEAALEAMRNDRRLKKTEANLAKLSQCSRGTLRNRGWPIETLRKLKLESKATTEASAAVTQEREETRVARYKQQLALSRDELMSWKFKHDDLALRVETLQGQNRGYASRVEALEARIRELERRLRGDKDDGNVVPLNR